VTVDAPGVLDLRQGRQIALTCDAERAAVVDGAGELVAIVVRAGPLWQPIKVF
jgi:hypothetical protein